MALSSLERSPPHCLAELIRAILKFDTADETLHARGQLLLAPTFLPLRCAWKPTYFGAERPLPTYLGGAVRIRSLLKVMLIDDRENRRDR